MFSRYGSVGCNFLVAVATFSLDVGDGEIVAAGGDSQGLQLLRPETVFQEGWFRLHAHLSAVAVCRLPRLTNLGLLTPSVPAYQAYHVRLSDVCFRCISKLYDLAGLV